MGTWPLVRIVALTGVLVCACASPSLAQVLRHDDATAKRNYGEPIPDGPPQHHDMTLAEASQSGGLAEARNAFLAGESVNSRTRKGVPVILIAAQANNISVLRFLLEKQANPDLYDKSTGRTALIAAAQAGQDNMVRILLDHKADPDRQDRQGETALMKAARVGAADVVQTLLKSDLDVNITDYAGNTALWHARASRNEDVVKMIKAAGGQ